MHPRQQFAIPTVTFKILIPLFFNFELQKTNVVGNESIVHRKEKPIGT